MKDEVIEIKVDVIEKAIDTRWESWTKMYDKYLDKIDGGRMLDWIELMEDSPEAKEIIIYWLLGLQYN